LQETPLASTKGESGEFLLSGKDLRREKNLSEKFDKAGHGTVKAQKKAPPDTQAPIPKFGGKNERKVILGD